MATRVAGTRRASVRAGVGRGRRAGLARRPGGPRHAAALARVDVRAARPGARRETVSTYIKRLEALEEIANSFPGVERSYAIQAGRELRIAVRPDEVDDLNSLRVARDVARRIEENLDYPGQIRVTVIREKRVVEIAK